MFSLPYYYPGRKKKVLKEAGAATITHVCASLPQMLFYLIQLLRIFSAMRPSDPYFALTFTTLLYLL